jgi:hypothetical protein
MVFPFLVGIFWYRRDRVLANVTAMMSGFLAALAWRFGREYLLDYLVAHNVRVNPSVIEDFQPALFGLLVSIVAFGITLPVTRKKPLGRWTEPLPATAREE